MLSMGKLTLMTDEWREWARGGAEEEMKNTLRKIRESKTKQTKNQNKLVKSLQVEDDERGKKRKKKIKRFWVGGEHMHSLGGLLKWRMTIYPAQLEEIKDGLDDEKKERQDIMR